jgi:hypothetical protein
MADIKNRINNYYFLIPKKKDISILTKKFLEYPYINDFTVSYSKILIDSFPEYLDIDKLYSPNLNPIDVLIETIEKFYLDKNNFELLSEKTEELLNEKHSNFSEEFKYKNSILFSVHFKAKPLYDFHPKERDLVLKKQEYFGISTEIELEKEDGTSDINTDLYSGWIDFRGRDILNEFVKAKTVSKLPKTAGVLDIAVNSEFIALFDHIFQKFQADTGFILLEVEPF